MTPVTRLRTVVGATFAVLVLLLFWSRTLSAVALLLAAVMLGVASVLETRRRRRWGRQGLLAGALLLLALALAGAAVTTARLAHGSRSWDEVVETRQAKRISRLNARLEGVIQRARSAAERAASLNGEGFAELAAIRSRTDVEAVAVLDVTGEPLAWAGDHRGLLPGAVMAPDSGVLFPGGTLFDYLYVLAPGPDGRRGVAAVLIQAGPPLRGATRSFAEGFEAVTGERPRFSPRPVSGADLTLRSADRPVLYVRFPPLNETEWRTAVARTGRQIVFGLGLLALGLLSATWLRSLEDRTGPAGLVPVAGLSVTFILAPLRRTLGLDQLFSPGFFVLPIPGDFVIEGVMVVLLPLAAVVATLRSSRISRLPELWLRLTIGAALAGGGFAVGATLMTQSAGRPMLTSAGPLWYVLQPTTVVLLTVLASLLMPSRTEPRFSRRSLLYGAAGFSLSVGLALAVSATWRPDQPLPTLALLAWSLPFLLLARFVADWEGKGERLVRWLVAGWLAATAVIPHLWVANQAATLDHAQEDVASFGARGDPYLNYLLVRLAEELQRSATRGEQRLDLLYEAWVNSGLASEPYPLEITLWDGDLERMAHLPVGVRTEPGAEAELELLDVVRRAILAGATLNEPAEGSGMSRILAVPLDGFRSVSVAVAPRASLRPTTALTAFMEDMPQPEARLELLPAGSLGPMAGPQASWRKTSDAWRSEMLLREGTDIYHAHLEVRLAPAGVRLARGMLLIALDLFLLTLLWALGRVVRGDPPIPPGGWVGWLAGFRVRLIVALFAFFLLPTAVFGWAAYRALADEVVRAATEVAERAVQHAGTLVVPAGLEEAARRTGEDLLYYQRGRLGAASLPEAVELGLYSAWMPPPLYLAIRSGESLGGTDVGELAGRSYLVAYRRLRSPAEAVAVPVWLGTRDVAVRQREFAHLVLFGALVGGILSLALSVVVGRALARPIGELRRAAAAVGRGRLRVRLPEQRADEFGELFASFNRMTRRLRRARAQELRTARILAWGEMARQVAHEIKNPLTPIKLSVQHLRRAHRDRRANFDEILDSNIEQILDEIERLTEIARAFSRYGAPQEAAGATEPVDVAAVTRDVLTLYSAPDRSVRYRLEVTCDRCVAAARPLELREVLVNLLENARAAVAESGRIEVRVSRSDRHVRLEVHDDGEGIPPDQIPRIFDPHFSTRSSGTGLGLAIVRRLVESWGGEVGVESEPGQGTAVRVLIPDASTPTSEGEAGVEA